MKSIQEIRSGSIASVIAGSLVVFAWMVAGAPARAADSGQTLSRTVTYGDLNLDTPAGAAALYGRLRVAAEQVCSPLEGRDLNLRARWQACYDKALASAVGQVNHTAVNALYASSVSRSPKVWPKG